MTDSRRHTNIISSWRRIFRAWKIKQNIAQTFQYCSHTIKVRCSTQKILRNDIERPGLLVRK